MEWAPHDEAGVGEGGCAGWSVVTAQAELLRGVRRGEDGNMTEEQHCATGGPVLLASACVIAPDAWLVGCPRLMRRRYFRADRVPRCNHEAVRLKHVRSTPATAVL
jgi:hypothetical protein